MGNAFDKVKEAINYREYYGQYVEFKGMSGGEQSVICCLHEEVNPSLSINLDTGFYHCHATHCVGSSGGDVFTFHQLKHEVKKGVALVELAQYANVDISDGDNSNVATGQIKGQGSKKFTVDMGGSEPEIKPKVKKKKEPKAKGVLPDETFIKRMHERLKNNEAKAKYIREDRGITDGLRNYYQIGFNGTRFTIPIRNSLGDLINVREYHPNPPEGEDKIKGIYGRNEKRLYPVETLKHDVIDICEGEWDALVGISVGLNAITVTAGAGKWDDTWSKKFAGKHVRVVFDSDEAGYTGAINVCRKLKEFAKSVKLITLFGPDEFNKYTHNDVSDYFVGNCFTLEDYNELVENTPEFLDEFPQIMKLDEPLRSYTRRTLGILYTQNQIQPKIFVRNNKLCRVIATDIVELDKISFRGVLTRSIDFVALFEGPRGKPMTKHINPPDDLTMDILSLGHWDFPEIEGVLDTPVLKPNGRILERAGYDYDLKSYYKPTKEFIDFGINEKPSDAELSMAIDFILDIFDQFPFKNEASVANTIGCLITPFISQIITGDIPLCLISANQKGTGKGLISDVVAAVATTNKTFKMGYVNKDEECRKQITSVLMSGPSIVIIDNVEGDLKGASLARLFTSRVWSDRELGKNKTVRLPNNAVWMATGNNITLRGDLSRRCYPVTMESKTSTPWERKGYKHPNLIKYVTDNRVKIITCIFTMIRRWWNDGHKQGKTSGMASFSSWAEIISGIFESCGINGFLKSQKELYEKVDAGELEWFNFFDAWYHKFHVDEIGSMGVMSDAPFNEKYESRPVSVHDISKAADGDDLEFRMSVPTPLVASMGKGIDSFKKSLGNYLSKKVGTRFGSKSYYIRSEGETVGRKKKQWIVVCGEDERKAKGISTDESVVDSDFMCKVYKVRKVRQPMPEKTDLMKSDPSAVSSSEPKSQQYDREPSRPPRPSTDLSEPSTEENDQNDEGNDDGSENQDLNFN